MMVYNDSTVERKKIFYPASERGFANHGWLKSFHSFSFGSYHNPEKTNFGLLRVLNDDTVEAGYGFGTHPHQNFEIVSIPLEGALSHKDSTGRAEVIREGEVQIMSAGTGISHSEYNHSTSDLVKFLQIWVFPKVQNIEPRYEQKFFDKAGRVNKFQTVVSPKQESGGVWINQDATFSLGDFETGRQIEYALQHSGNGIYLFVIEGEIEFDSQVIGRRDAIGVSGQNTFSFKALKDSKLLLIEVPMN
ncbi:MAG: pirin family protein [Chloroherpetonaceae bacterium]|nr:pirin family protein [Chloroherpetonaceae bacterium]